MGFNDTIDEIVTLLEGDTALAAWCTAQFSKALTVKRVFKLRVEIGLDELPIIMITNPDKTPGAWTYGERRVKHTLRLYFGFHQPDREAAQEQTVDFEELIEAALLKYKDGTETLPTGVLSVDPRECSTDEGYYHPVYFGVKDVVVEKGQIL